MSDKKRLILVIIALIVFACLMLALEIGSNMVEQKYISDYSSTHYPDFGTEEENMFLNALAVATGDPEVTGMIGNRSIVSIGFSKDFDEEIDEDCIQLEFRYEDPDPDDCLHPSIIMVRVNSSGNVSSAYETYPAYIAGCQG